MNSAHQSLPMFRIGSGEGSPLLMLAGGLILDTGEAERTFIYRCQDRFLSYASLLGGQSVFFAANDAHVAEYRRLIADLAQRFDRISARTTVFGECRIVEPLFVLADPDTLTLTLSNQFDARLSEGSVRAMTAGIATNQISPTYARLAASLLELLRQEGINVGWEASVGFRMADLAMRYQDKAEFSSLIRSRFSESRSHLPTFVVDLDQLQRFPTWSALTSAFRVATGVEPPSSFFAKTSRNSSGNLAGRIDAVGMHEQILALAAQAALESSGESSDIAQLAAELRLEVDENPALRAAEITDKQIREFKQSQAALRHNLRILLQPELDPKVDRGDRPAGIGLSYLIRSPFDIDLTVANAQVYRDPGHRHFLGAYLSPLIAEYAGADLVSEGRALCQVLANEGYCGPVNFDVCLDCCGEYRFINDCNPRLTGVFPSLAVKAALEREGQAPVSLLTLGYRGEFVALNLDDILSRLQDSGLLLGPGQSTGVVVLPNLCRDNGYDLHLVGFSVSEANRMLAPNGKLAGIFGSVPGVRPVYI